MRQISIRVITETVKDLAMRANFELREDMADAFRVAMEREESPLGREILAALIENASIAREQRLPICQDTGVAVIFVELGQEVSIVGGDFKSALEEGVRQAYEEGYFRKSMCHPLTRENTGDNTPIILHLDMVPGDRLRIWVVPKGGGSENMSRLFMLPPSVGEAGIIDRIVGTVEEAGPNPCPPTIIGVGIGGNFEQCAMMAKKAILRSLGTPNPEPDLDILEREVLERINRTGIGPQGFGGRVTSLAVHILMMPCHIASLPLAVNIQCHASRHLDTVL